ncbi:co-chaperone DjlA [Halomonas urumqiensis]|uniref:Co-chaperone DjlA n=1 Tax=Halomonas urumqiensis TaxID=1684789 RepID=A0A2N7UFC6_9GAMM|nr:co-chaperone DjlA [Halomonas urumqiensis]PMR79120.1 co-chaperone DjlA [Halomonas urumqiensis]PTB03794.1 co-chaperone DjlA [Halomonas urumqiensis]GHE19975.1 co-chaperone protein DjlA [Halomonas urumqiensis]
MLVMVLIGGLLGYLVGGPLGLLVGGGLGYWLARRIRRGIVGRLAAVQTQFLESTFAVMGCMCKADGQVSEDELEASRQLWDRLRLSEPQRAKARADFTRGKSADFDLDAELAKLRPIVGSQPALRQVFLQVQLAAIAADGELHSAEHEMLMRVVRGLGCSEAEVAQIEAMLRGATEGGGATTHEVSLEDAYQVLGVESDASDAEIKRQYRRLMSENHPDKLAAKGLPDNMREVAKERTSEIGNAYDRIRKARAAETA